MRLAEVVASLSLATGLCTGLPIEHGLRRALLATWIGEELGLSRGELSDVYYVALLGSVGCTVEQTLFAQYADDDIALNARTLEVDPSSALSAYRFALLHFGSGQPPLKRARTLLSAITSGGPGAFQAVCRDVALQIGDMMRIGPRIQEALAQCHELWNGQGGPRGLAAEEISVPARIFHVAASAEVFSRTGGAVTAVVHARRLTGRHYDPRIAERFCEIAEGLYRRLESMPPWEAALEAEPGPQRMLDASEFDDLMSTIATFVDLRTPYTLRHSTEVGALAERTAARMGLPAVDVIALRHAGYLHDLGRIGVPVTFWNAPSWTPEQRERARAHPLLTEQVLARSSALGHLGIMAGLHHERLDGTGYRGVRASFLPVAARILAAADTYRSKTEERPHRAALSPHAAIEDVRRLARGSKLDPDVVRALADVVGITVADRTPDGPPVPLSRRELEVLRLLVRGTSNRRIADLLDVSPKTVGHHVEHIYDKLGVSTRVGATLFALRHGLVEPPDVAEIDMG